MKKKLLALLLMLLIPLSAAYAATTHYGYVTPTVGGSQNTWGTLLNTAIGAIDTNIWAASGGMTTAVNAQSSSANITLTNPINSVQNITMTTTGKKLILPAMNATGSLVPGGQFLTINNVGSNSFDVDAQDGTTGILVGLAGGKSVQIQLLTNGTANGTFQTYGPYLTSVSGNVSLGTSVSAANPSNATATNTGLFSSTTGSVGVSVLGTQVGSFTSTGYIGAIGATTSNTGAFTSITTPSATITGGTINGASLGATTSSSVKASTLVAGGITYPTTNGTSGQTLQTSGSGTASWGSNLFYYAGGTLQSTVAANSTNYMWLGVASTPSAIIITLPPGTLKNLFMQTSAVLTSGQSVVLTVWDENANTSTGITCTISSGAAQCSDITHTYVASGSHAFDIHVVTNASIGSQSYTFALGETVP